MQYPQKNWKYPKICKDVYKCRINVPMAYHILKHKIRCQIRCQPTSRSLERHLVDGTLTWWDGDWIGAVRNCLSCEEDIDRVKPLLLGGVVDVPLLGVLLADHWPNGVLAAMGVKDGNINHANARICRGISHTVIHVTSIKFKGESPIKLIGRITNKI